MESGERSADGGSRSHRVKADPELLYLQKLVIVPNRAILAPTQ
jgi:hypothetical protein